MSRALRAGKTGSTRGSFGWTRYRYTEQWPAVIFALTAWAGIQGSLAQIDAMGAHGFSVLRSLALLFFLWWTYSFIIELAYWFAVHAGASQHRQHRARTRQTAEEV